MRQGGYTSLGCNVADSKRAAFPEPRMLSRKSVINVKQSRYDYQVAVRRQSIAILSPSPSVFLSHRSPCKWQMSQRTYRCVDIHRTIMVARSSGNVIIADGRNESPGARNGGEYHSLVAGLIFPRSRTTVSRFRAILRPLLWALRRSGFESWLAGISEWSVWRN